MTDDAGTVNEPEGWMRRGPSWAVPAWTVWVLTLLGLAASFWLDHLLRQGGRHA